MKKHEGFTLVEILISMFVGMVIIGAIYAAVVSSQRSTGSIERKVVAGQDARAALELMAIEIQMASYNPTYAPDIWTESRKLHGGVRQPELLGDPGGDRLLDHRRGGHQ